MKETNSPPPKIKSNWWRLVLYFIWTFIGVGIFCLPLFLFHPELISGSRNEYNAVFESPPMKIANLLAMSAGAFVATYFMVTKIEYRSLNSIRFNYSFKELIYGGAIALIAFLLFALIAQSFQIVDIRYQGFSVNLLYSFIFYSLVAFNEELMFRGYILHNFLEKMNPIWALLFSSLLFGLVHYSNDHFTWLGCLTISVSGFLMGLLVLKGGSLSSAIGVHWAWNFVQGPVLGFEVSGNDQHGIFKPTRLADDIFTGGAFGGEGSVLLAGITAVIVFIIWLKLKKRSSIE